VNKTITLMAALATTVMLLKANVVYSTTCIVVDLDYETDMVTVSAASGLLYEFTGIDDYWYGDLVSVTFYNNGTEIVTDDIILAHRYVGWPELFNEAWDAYDGGGEP